MEELFEKYLEKINLQNLFKKRVFEIINFYSSICPEKIADIFIADYMNDDGQREYENLWLFSNSFFMEARDFILKDDFDFAPRGNGINYWRIKKEHYDFKESTAKSRFVLYFSWGKDFNSEDIKSSGINCDYLKEIFEKYVIEKDSK